MIDKLFVSELINQHYTDSEKFLVDINISVNNKIIILIDGEQGINVKDCVELSRFIESNLDREVEDFDLEVSSFGVGQDLQNNRQYKNLLGKKLEVNGIDGNIYQGKLVEITTSGITLELDLTKKQIKEKQDIIKTFTFEEIKSSKSIVSFN